MISIIAAGGSSFSDTGALYGLIGGIVTATVVLIGQLVLRRQQKDKLIAEASNEVAEGARTLLEQYRQELQSCVQQSRDLRERVAVLEDRLSGAKEDHDELRRRREDAVREMNMMQERIEFLESNIKTLEATTLRSGTSDK